ncbi:hypothetical protein KQM40_004245 [Escherichia coli]|nr:hypothetical protein [Escherichia coli]
MKTIVNAEIKEGNKINILTVYGETVESVSEAINKITQKIAIEILASDPARLFNDVYHDDVSLPCFTFKTESTFDKVKKCIPVHVYLCQEDPEDWI